MIIYTFKG